MTDNLSPISISSANIFFLNFSGQPSRYNKDGNRDFAVEVPAEMVSDLQADGWNVKFRKDQDKNPDPERPHLTVKVRYGFRPPAIWMIVGDTKTLLAEESVGLLDNADISNVDLVIQPRPYEIGGATGIAAYVKTMYVTIAPDEFSERYADLEIR